MGPPSPLFLYIEQERMTTVGRQAKCRVCGEKVDTATAYKVITYDTNNKENRAYYCSKEEYEANEAKKKKAAADKDKAYWLICEIIGRKEIINTALWKEWKIWNKVASNEIIAQYLEENKKYLMNVISKLDDVEFNRIRYLSTILKNKIGDYKPKKEEKEPIKMESDFELFVPKAKENKQNNFILDDVEDDLL